MGLRVTHAFENAEHSCRACHGMGSDSHDRHFQSGRYRGGGKWGSPCGCECFGHGRKASVAHSDDNANDAHEPRVRTQLDGEAH